jgi:hypothetical protein
VSALQGVVSSTEELHALEEQGFAAWQAGLAHKAQQLAAAPDSTDAAAAAAAAATSSKARQQANRLQQQEPPPQQQQHEEQQQQLVQGLVAGLGPISPYEGRLEFWRQLWRTLEMSDVICMIVDARWLSTHPCCVISEKLANPLLSLNQSMVPDTLQTSRDMF